MNGLFDCTLARHRHITSRSWCGVVMAVLALEGCESSHNADQPGAYEITVYYTAVESFHGGNVETVHGHLSRDSAADNDLLGIYPASFIAAVQSEGTGRITSGIYAGRYLNWSYDVGYWLDTVPANAYGNALVPFQTAAADLDVLARGTRFKLIAPLIQDNGAPLDSASATRLLSAEWNIQDQFTPGSGGARHLDLYIGEEDQPDFTDASPLYTTLINTKTEFR